LSWEIAMTAPVRAALYLRVSTGRQVDNDLSIPDQRRQAKGYCTSRGWQIVADYVESGASATDDRRPEFQRMIDAVPPSAHPSLCGQSATLADVRFSDIGRTQTECIASSDMAKPARCLVWRAFVVAGTRNQRYLQALRARVPRLRNYPCADTAL
jgi:resolvase-like protein